MEWIIRNGYEPEPNWIDHGVILRLAPLWELLPLWKSEPKKYWERPARGDFDWSHIAMKYWPDRVREKCKTNKSFVIAHGLERISGGRLAAVSALWVPRLPDDVLYDMIYDVLGDFGTQMSERSEAMGRYALNLPAQLKADAEQIAAKQGISLNQFILWAVSEKVGSLKHQLDDPAYPHITYRRGAAGRPEPVLRGSGLRVQTVVVAAQQWGLSPAQIAEEFGQSEGAIREALAFYANHRQEIDANLAAEGAIELAATGARA